MKNQSQDKDAPKKLLWSPLSKRLNFPRTSNDTGKYMSRHASSRAIINCSSLFSLEKSTGKPVSSIETETHDGVIRKQSRGDEGDDSVILELVEIMEKTRKPIPGKSVEKAKRIAVSLAPSKNGQNAASKGPFRMRRISIKGRTTT